MKRVITIFYLMMLLSLSLHIFTFKVKLIKEKEEGVKRDNEVEPLSLFEYNKKIFLFKNGFIENAEKFKFKNKSTISKTKTESKNKSVLRAKAQIQSENNSKSYNIIYKGWLKYLEINEDSVDVPSCFNKNQVYYLQMSENSGINTLAKDNIGYINIPNEEYFYFELTSVKLEVYSARSGNYRKFQKSVKLEDLIPQANLSPCKGGVEDVGNFAEGYCFMIKYVNYTRHFIWELCAESSYEKDRWMKKIIETNAKKKVENRDLVVTDTVVAHPVVPAAPVSIFDSGPTQALEPIDPVHPLVLSTVHPLVPSPVRPLVHPLVPSPIHPLVHPLVPSPVHPPVQPIPPPGYQVVGVWSPCSKPCGQGVQSIMLDCMDENLCRGKKFQERLCNIQACKEDVEKHLDKLKKVADGQWDKVVVSAVPLFERSAFEECKLLEGNLMLVINNQKILSHVEVNMQSMQIFTQNNPGVPIVMPLSRLVDVRPSVSIPGCFKMIDSLGTSRALCPSAPEVTSCEVWVKRIREFKHNCSNKILTKIHNDIESSIEMSKNPNSKSQQLNQIQDKVLADEKLRSSIKEKTLEAQFEEFKRQTRDLLEKENSYETKLEQEEKERIEWEQKKLKDNVAKEQEMANKLLHDIQSMADADSSYAAKERAIKREMKNMMNEVQSKITEKREKLANKLQMMKTLKELEEKKAAKELIDMKREMGKKLSNMSKKGNPSQCYTRNPAMIDNYCTMNYKDLDMQLECKKPNQFCYMCCDSEIGALNKNNLNCCYNKCDDISNSQCMTFNETYLVSQQQVAFLS